MMMKTVMAIAAFSVVTIAAASASVAENRIVLSTDITWEKLNPARGEKSPQAATIWGDRQGTVATGFLVKFVDGFASPPHIHNVSYRGVVIEGQIHNDDPQAKEMWMPAGSFWTQPKGENHITAALGPTNIAYIEIENGPYLVLPKEKAFDSGERPVNVDRSNIVWFNVTDTRWGVPQTSATQGPQVALLWGNTEKGQMNGSFIKLPAGFSGTIKSHGQSFRAVIIRGVVRYHDSRTESTALDPGSSFISTEASSAHRLSSQAHEETVIYVRTNGTYQVAPD